MNLTFNRNDIPDYYSSTKWYKIIQHWKLTGKIREASLFHTLATKNLFKQLYTPESKESFCNQIDSMITILNAVHRDNWDFHLEPMMEDKFNEELDDYVEYLYSFKFGIIIYYDKIEIKNSENLKHNIRDLFVYIPFEIHHATGNIEDYVPLTPKRIQGTKATYSYEEYEKGYVHSHLTVQKPNYFSECFQTKEFCTGSNEVNDLQATLRAEYTPEIFDLYLQTINAMMEWESLEGNPHIKINTITLGSNTSAINHGEGTLRDLYKTFRMYLKKQDFKPNFVYSESRFKIKKDAKLESIFKKTIIDASLKSKLLVTQVNSSFHGFSFPQITRRKTLLRKLSRDKELPYLLFRNKKFKINIENFRGEMPSVDNYFTYPKFTDYATERLEQELHSKLVRRSTLEKYYQSTNV